MTLANTDKTVYILLTNNNYIFYEIWRQKLRKCMPLIQDPFFLLLVFHYFPKKSKGKYKILKL
jgi:hypothetical protein